MCGRQYLTPEDVYHSKTHEYENSFIKSQEIQKVLTKNIKIKFVAKIKVLSCLTLFGFCHFKHVSFKIH